MSVVVIGWLSYRALFTWLNPMGYVANRLIQPVAIASLYGVFVSSLTGDTFSTLVGASVLALATSMTFGISMAIANERQFGTLEIWMASPQGFVVGLIGRTVPHILDGLVAAVLSLGTSLLIFRISVSPTHVAAALPAYGVTAFSMAGVSLLMAALAVWTRDALGGPNLAALVLELCTGALIAVLLLPIPLFGVQHILPVSASQHAAKIAMTSGDIAIGWLWREMAVGSVYLLVGLCAVALAFRRVRATGLASAR